MVEYVIGDEELDYTLPKIRELASKVALEIMFGHHVKIRCNKKDDKKNFWPVFFDSLFLYENITPERLLLFLSIETKRKDFFDSILSSIGFDDKFVDETRRPKIKRYIRMLLGKDKAKA